MPPLIRPSAVDDAGDAVRQVIRAYHGSPYDFDRFDASLIGKGTGTQMAGHGLYFAESERIANRYRFPKGDRLPLASAGRKPTGRVYHVEIAHPHDRLIDFESPLADQPVVADAMERVAKQLSPRDARLFSKFLAEGPDGQNAYLLLDHMLGPARAAQSMQELGVPGTRFLDVTGEGTRNYVIFPGAEDQIRILRKFAVPGLVGTGAAAMSGEE